MRKLFYLMFTLTFLSCSSNSDSDNINNEQTESNNDKLLLVKSIIGDGDNGKKLDKSSSFNGNYSFYDVYELNANSKISMTTRYYDDASNPDNTTSINFDSDLNYNDGIENLNYTWESNKLILPNGDVFHFSNNQIFKIEHTDSSYPEESYTINIVYAENEISKVEKIFKSGKKILMNTALMTQTILLMI